MKINNGFNVLPWYDSLDKQNCKKWYTYGQTWPLLCPQGSILPFQFISDTAISISSNIYAINTETKQAIDLGVKPAVIEVNRADITYYIVKLANTSIVQLPIGRYNFRMNTSEGFLYSEEVSVIDNANECIKVEYWNEDTLRFTSGEINFADDFHFILYVNSTIGKPEYEFEEELTKRLGYKFIESQTSNKVYKFSFVAPEYVCDAMRLIRMCDYIKLTTKFDSYNALSFAYEPKWQEQGDLAAVDVEFDTDCIIQKLESFNRRVKESFYNALLADIDEPMLFSTDTVAQYYTEYTSAAVINGKLIRQLNAIGNEELKSALSSIVLPIDNQSDTSQEAKKVFLQDILGLVDTVSKLFRGHYDEAGNLLWIEALANMGVNGGVTMFIDNGSMLLPSIFDALPIDGKTLVRDANGVLMVSPNIDLGGGLDEAELESYLTSNNYAKKSDIPSLADYATKNYVNDRVTELINGAPAAYDTLKEIADVLEGNVNSIGDIITVLGNKADATELAKYIPIQGYTDIHGEKNFTGGLKVNGSPIVYDADNKYWKLEGDLLVTGGVTMYSSDTEFTPSTIMDAIVVDNVTIVKQDGKLVAVGGGSSGGGVADSVVWGNVLGKPSWITDTIPYVNIAGTKVSLGGSITQAGLRTALGLGSNAYSSTAYLPLTGGTITASVVPLMINRTGYTVSAIHFQTNSVNVGRIGVGEDNNPKFMKAADGTWHNLWHAGNDGAGSGLDADLLDGKHYSDIINGNVASATKLQTARTIWGQSFNGTADITGDLKLGLSRILGVDDALLVTSSTDAVTFGYGTSVKGIPTYIDGNVINFRYGTTRTIGMILNSNGGLTIGTSDLASSSYKLYVGGATRITGNIIFGGEIYKPIPSGGTYKPFRIIQTADYALIQVSSHDGVSANGVLQLAGGLNGSLSQFKVLAGTSYISGKLGLGVSAPTEKLHVAGNILATGGVTMYSMRSLKNVVDEKGLSLEELSVIKPTRYTWKDGRDNKMHIGGIADDVMKVLPEVVYKTEGGVLTMDYGNAAFAIAASLINPIVEHERNIKFLQLRVRELEEEIKRLKSA